MLQLHAQSEVDIRMPRAKLNIPRFTTLCVTTPKNAGKVTA